MVGKSPHPAPWGPDRALSGILTPLRQAGRFLGSFDGYACQRLASLGMNVATILEAR